MINRMNLRGVRCNAWTSQVGQIRVKGREQTGAKADGICRLCVGSGTLSSGSSCQRTLTLRWDPSTNTLPCCEFHRNTAISLGPLTHTERKGENRSESMTGLVVEDAGNRAEGHRGEQTGKESLPSLKEYDSVGYDGNCTSARAITRYSKTKCQQSDYFALHFTQNMPSTE